jgi:hypothetical protein
MDNRIAEWDQAKWLVATSCTFFIPAILATYYKHYYLAATLWAVVFSSINHWRDPKYDSIRRKFDVVCVYHAVIMLTIIAFSTIKDKQFLGSAVILLLIAIEIYFISNKFRDVKSDKWLGLHGTFHLLSAFLCCAVIYKIT